MCQAYFHIANRLVANSSCEQGMETGPAKEKNGHAREVGGLERAFCAKKLLREKLSEGARARTECCVTEESDTQLGRNRIAIPSRRPALAGGCFASLSMPTLLRPVSLIVLISCERLEGMNQGVWKRAGRGANAIARRRPGMSSAENACYDALVQTALG